MTNALDDLVSLLDLERSDENTFRGNSMDIGTKSVYGGQIVAQTLRAAQLTVDNNKKVHSLPAYFLRRGNYKLPISFMVDIIRNGRSFTARRVTAIQQNEPIFIIATSFHIDEIGLEYQQAMLEIPGPDMLKSIAEYGSGEQKQLPEALNRLLKLSSPFIIKPVVNQSINIPRPETNQRHFRIKTIHPLPDDHDLHCAILAYISDYGLVTTTLVPHGLKLEDPAIQLVSIDHGMWFHRPFRVDEWVLYSCEAITTSNATGLSKGSMYSLDGKLVATTIQEGLIRQREMGN